MSIYELMKIELYKLIRKKLVWVLLLINLLPLMYAMALRFHWSFVSVSVEGFSVVNFVSTMWTMVFIFGVPLFVLLFLSAGLLASERTEGQLMLAVTRVANRSKILEGKFLAVTMLTTLFFIINILCSVLSFYFFIYGSVYFLPMEMNSSLLSEIVLILGVYIFILLLCYLVLLCSTKLSMVVSVVVVLLMYAGFSIMNYLPYVKYILPGYWALNSIEFSSGTWILLLQVSINLLLIVLVIRRSKTIFNTIDL